jgi:hypothetical protein
MSNAAEPRSPSVAGWLLRDLPYAVMLALALGGIVLTAFQGPATYYYWMALAPIYGLISVISGWSRLDTGGERLQLVLTQALHWLAFVGAMWLMFLPQVRGVENDNATSLTLLILLALGTFVAGVHARAWRVCTVGVFLALSVPAVAWIQVSAVLVLVALVLVAVAAAGFWWMWRRESRL